MAPGTEVTQVDPFAPPLRPAQIEEEARGSQSAAQTRGAIPSRRRLLRSDTEVGQ